MICALIRRGLIAGEGRRRSVSVFIFRPFREKTTIPVTGGGVEGHALTPTQDDSTQPWILQLPASERIKHRRFDSDTHRHSRGTSCRRETFHVAQFHTPFVVLKHRVAMPSHPFSALLSTPSCPSETKDTSGLGSPLPPLDAWGGVSARPSTTPGVFGRPASGAANGGSGRLLTPPR